jgi:hypothetical protein
VTSAESVLISQQSQEELYRVAGENKKLEQVFCCFVVLLPTRFFYFKNEL